MSSSSHSSKQNDNKKRILTCIPLSPCICQDHLVYIHFTPDNKKVIMKNYQFSFSFLKVAQVLLLQFKLIGYDGVIDKKKQSYHYI